MLKFNLSIAFLVLSFSFSGLFGQGIVISHSPEKSVFIDKDAFQANYSFWNFQSNVMPKDSLPDVYDMRNAGPAGTSLLTPVKHQDTCGACWAFATMASVESRLMVLGIGEYDLSENNLKNCHGFELLPCEWGHHFMSTAYFNRIDGPVLESADPYVPANVACTEGLSPDLFITDARYLPDDLDYIKMMIQKYGGIYTTMYFNSDFYNFSDYTYCDTIHTNTSHAILLVGWDDNKYVSGGPLSPPNGRIGAFICRNTYGPNFGENGYFYVAYDDNLIKKYCSYWPLNQKYLPESEVYGYDEIGGWPFAGYYDSIAHGLVKFTASRDQMIYMFGTYIVGVGSTVDIEAYQNFDGNNLSGLSAGLYNNYCELPGFYTFELSQPLRVDSADSFYIRIRYNSPGLEFPMAIETYETGYTDPDIETGKYWASPDGLVWEALGEGTPALMDLCIRAYAVDFCRTDLKVFLEGSYDSITGTMHSHLQQSGNMPVQQPFDTVPWNYAGSETIDSVPSVGITDWLLVELRETDGGALTATADKIVVRKACVLTCNGSILDPVTLDAPRFNLTLQDSLYAVIHHRNHLSIMTSGSILTDCGTFNYDFTDDLYKAFGSINAQKQLSQGAYGMIAGDGDANGQINNPDKNNIWNQSAGLPGYHSADFNLDGEVNNTDKNELWLPNSGSGCQVP